MILSLHYPKTAGTSFRHTLARLYYGHIFFHYHGAHYERNIKAKGNREEIEIIHGHFNIKHYIEMFPDSTLITWLRDPAARTLSYYNYKKYNLSEKPRGGTPNNRQFLAFLDSEQFEFFVEKFDRFFGDYQVKDFTFVGITERYNEDLAKLAKLMGWGGYRTHFLNTSRNYENIVLTDEIKQRIYKRMAREYEMWRGVYEHR